MASRKKDSKSDALNNYQQNPKKLELKLLNNRMVMMYLVPYIKSDRIISFALLNVYANMTIDSNKYRKDLS